MQVIVFALMGLAINSLLQPNSLLYTGQFIFCLWVKFKCVWCVFGACVCVFLRVCECVYVIECDCMCV